MREWRKRRQRRRGPPGWNRGCRRIGHHRHRLTVDSRRHRIRPLPTRYAFTRLGPDLIADLDDFISVPGAADTLFRVVTGVDGSNDFHAYGLNLARSGERGLRILADLAWSTPILRAAHSDSAGLAETLLDHQGH